MSESDQQFEVLTVDESRAGETVTVVSTTSTLSGKNKQKGRVEADGTVVQHDSGVAFNGAKYDVQ